MDPSDLKTVVSDTRRRAASINPFPATAVARLARPEDEFWSIETDALKEARAFLRDYLQGTKRPNAAGAKAKKGIVLAIVGDYGTGKTHIAQDLLREIDAQKDEFLHPLYLDAPSDTFLALYRQRFMEKVSRKDVLRRVEDLYSDVVATELERTDITAPAAKRLRSREIDPDEIVKTLGLIESSLLRELGTLLRRVTERNDFGTALLLLRRPEFEPAVWEWLSGDPPDPILQERGIQRQISDDAGALEAIGVLAFLFGRQGHKFILFIDELEKVFSHNSQRRPDEAAVLAFKKLMEVIGETQSLLVLIGLPECLDVLPDDARQRISGIIRPSAITSGEIEHYIREAQRRGLGSEVLEPFTKDTVEYLAEIAGGNARRVLRLCYHAYLASREGNTTITRATLREIAREQFELIPADDVVAEITRCIEARGWLFDRNKVYGAKDKLRIDFWLPVGSNGSGTALFLTTSLLQEKDSKGLIAAASTIKAENAEVTVETVLVVNGYLADNLRTSIEKVFSKIIIYRLRGFREDLDAALGGIRVRLEEGHRQNVMELIRQKVDEIARQNSGFDSRLSELMQAAPTRSELKHAVSAGLRGVFGQLAGASNIAETQFPHISALFDEVLGALERLLQLDAFFDLLFGVPAPVLRKGAQFRMRRAKTSDVITKKLLTTGVLATMQTAVFACSAFRRGIFWLLSNIAERASFDNLPKESESSVVMELCRTFDSFAEHIDLRQAVADLQTARHRLQLEEEPFVSGELEIIQPDDEIINQVQRMLRDLGRNVYFAVRDEIERRPVLK